MWEFEREGGYETGLREIRKVSLCVFFYTYIEWVVKMPLGSSEITEMA